MNLMRAELDYRKVLEYAMHPTRKHKMLNRARLDLSKVFHHLMRESFGKFGLITFRHNILNNGAVIVQGYTDHEFEQLIEHLYIFNTHLRNIYNDIKVKEFPVKEFKGKYSFNLLTRPEVQDSQPDKKNSTHRDVYMYVIDKWLRSGGDVDSKPQKEIVYNEWLARKFNSSAIRCNGC